MWSEEALRAWADSLGFARMALCAADGFETVRQAVQRQKPIRERRQLRYDPRGDFPHARSLAVLLWPYAPARMEGGSAVFIDSYYAASNVAYHAAQTLEQRAAQAGGFVRANVSYPAREAAVRAGLGVIGKNGLLITPQFGTRVVIILLVTDLDAPAAPMRRMPSCAGCGMCAKACPTGAIDEEGLSHPERCLRNFMMEGVVVPEEMREKMGMRLLGCDLCQRVCPMQVRLPDAPDMGVTLDDFMTLDERIFSQSVARLAKCIGQNMARPQRVRAQAALLAGNRCVPDDLPVLREWAKSPFEAVASHARWAADRILKMGSGCADDMQKK